MPSEPSPHATPPDEPQQSNPGPHPRPRLLRSEELLQGDTEVLIVHGDSTYRLRQTKSGKLILNK